MCHQSQKGSRGIFVEISQHKKGYLVYVPHKRKIISLYSVVFDEIFSNELMYTSQAYSEKMVMRPAMSCIPYAKYSKENTGDIITFAQFEERNLLSEYRNDTESGKNLMTIQLFHH